MNLWRFLIHIGGDTKVETYRFDQEINRYNTSCLKYDFKSRYNKPEDVFPMWVADMDFEVPQVITEAIKKRAEHGIYGYTIGDDRFYNSLISWMQTRHQYETKKEWYLQIPGVVFGLAMAVRAFTNPGDAVMVQTPVYYPFYKCIENNHRVVVKNSLIYEKDGTPAYRMDYDKIEEDIVKHQVKLFILCSPHNPVGRVWTEEELIRLGEILERHQVLLVSDEIHMDFIFGQRKHHVFAGLKPSFENFTITCTAPSKTFNLAGLQLANLIVSNEEIRERLRAEIQATGYAEPNVFGLVACQAAYESGGDYLDHLIEYLEGNVAFVKEFLKENLPKVKLIEPEGMYLLWLDFNEYGLSSQEITDIIVKKAKLWFNAGEIFGDEGLGFQRINIATNRAVVERAMNQLKDAFQGL